MCTPQNALDDAERAGFDLSLVDENLLLTPTQRVEQLQEALNLVLELEKAGRALRRDAE
jgi:hypothetical protein